MTNAELEELQNTLNKWVMGVEKQLSDLAQHIERLERRDELQTEALRTLKDMFDSVELRLRIRPITDTSLEKDN